LQQEIIDAANKVARKLSEDDPTLMKIDQNITEVMLSAAKLKTNSYKGQFSKFLAVAHLALDDEFINEV